MERLLILTGTMGAGKTTVLAEASDLLALRHIPHAAIDMDALGLAYLPTEGGNDDVMYRNLQSVCENYFALGVKSVLLARAIETRAELERCRSAVSAANIVVCLITAKTETMEQRVRMRESGMLQADYTARVAKLNAILDQSQLENFTVNNQNRSIADVALEVLAKAGWISK